MLEIVIALLFAVFVAIFIAALGKLTETKPDALERLTEMKPTDKTSEGPPLKLFDEFGGGTEMKPNDKTSEEPPLKLFGEPGSFTDMKPKDKISEEPPLKPSDEPGSLTGPNDETSEESPLTLFDGASSLKLDIFCQKLANSLPEGNSWISDLDEPRVVVVNKIARIFGTLDSERWSQGSVSEVAVRRAYKMLGSRAPLIDLLQIVARSFLAHEVGENPLAHIFWGDSNFVPQAFRYLLCTSQPEWRLQLVIWKEDVARTQTVGLSWDGQQWSTDEGLQRASLSALVNQVLASIQEIKLRPAVRSFLDAEMFMVFAGASNLPSKSFQSNLAALLPAKFFEATFPEMSDEVVLEKITQRIFGVLDSASWREELVSEAAVTRAHEMMGRRAWSLAGLLQFLADSFLVDGGSLVSLVHFFWGDIATKEADGYLLDANKSSWQLQLKMRWPTDLKRKLSKCEISWDGLWWSTAKDPRREASLPRLVALLVEAVDEFDLKPIYTPTRLYVNALSPAYSLPDSLAPSV